MAQRMKVTYLDAHEIDVIVSPKAQVMTERHFGFALAEAKTMEQLYYLAWAALHYSGKEADDYESWLGKIEDVEDIPTHPVDPTPSTPTAGGSSGSVSRPESLSTS